MSCEEKKVMLMRELGRASPGIIVLIDVEFNTAHTYSERFTKKHWRVVTMIFL